MCHLWNKEESTTSFNLSTPHQINKKEEVEEKQLNK